ncbi:MAG: 4'-phosphopantetheinyl transferase superfamily protein [Clostridia bacterium]|nr:4'-phosphopantetheinyl transferase superfamily protein [Clostridia bacterium]
MKAYIRILDLSPLLDRLNEGKGLREIEKDELFRCKMLTLGDITEIKDRIFDILPPQNEKSGENDGEIVFDKKENAPDICTILGKVLKCGEKSLKTSKNIEELVSLAPAFYQNYIKEAKSEARRVERLGAFLVLSSIYHDVFADFLPNFERNEKGKPYFPDNHAIFSISHSKNLVCVAFYPCKWGKETDNAEKSEKSGGNIGFLARIGVDLEARVDALDEKALENAEKTSRRFFSDEESSELNALCKEEFTNAFALIWTLRESYVKMTGDGFSRFKTADLSSAITRSYRVKTNGKEFILSVCIG